ncbi:unnamed protein product [Urochloa humidicola]
MSSNTSPAVCYSKLIWCAWNGGSIWARIDSVFGSSEHILLLALVLKQELSFANFRELPSTEYYRCST